VELTIRIIIYAIIVLSYCFSLWLSILNYKNRNAAIPEEVNDIYDEKAYQKWHEYNMANFKFSIVTNTISTLVFLLLLITGFFPLINRISIDLVNHYELQVLFFMGFYYLVQYMIGIFTSYYQIFTIEEEFGFNKSTKVTFVKDKLKNLLLTIILGGGLVYGLASLYSNVSSMFFVYAFLFLVAILLVTNLLYVKVFVPMFNKLTPLEDGSLKTKIVEFAKSVGYEVNKISIMDASKRSSKLNAYFSGFGKLKQVVLYDTLVDKCSDEEVVSVLAHEIGHNKHKHMWSGLLQTIIQIAIYIAVLVLFFEVPVFSKAFGFSESNFGFALVMFTVLMTPLNIPISLITNYISRLHEYQADNYAATNYSKEHIESSLKVLTRENFNNLTPHPVYVKMYYSHPPTADRIRAIRKVK